MSQVRSVALQVLLDVPGDEVRAGTLTSVDLPHLLWRDEGSFAPITIEWENTGTTTDTITGSIRMKSLFGNTARKLQMHEMVVLRGGTRTQRVLWHDPPWIGRFTPEVTAIGVAGERMTLRGHAIWIVPPWQYVLATVIAAIGGWVWYRRRQRQAAAGLEDEREP